MSLTILYTGKNQQRHVTLNIRWLFAIFILAIFFLFIFFFFYTSWQQYTYNARQSLLLNNGQYSHSLQEKKRMNEQLITLASQVGAMQAQVARINALGQLLADKNELKGSGFDFSQPLPMGGGEDEGPLPTIAPEAFSQQVAQLQKELDNSEKQISLLDAVLRHQDVGKESYISGMPVAAKNSWLSSPFGVRFDPFTGKSKMHRGVDIAALNGSDIVATGAGVVSWAGKRRGYGNLVEVMHPEGMVTRYAHTADILVSAGDVVEKGQVLALIGLSGRSTGPHVHYEVLKNGTQINPSKYIQRKAAN